MLKVSPCSKICHECGFTKKGMKNTLYAEVFDIIQNGVVFPCHMYLKKHSGHESFGTENLQEIKVCRGYIAYMKKHKLDVIETWNTDLQYFWFQNLLNEISDEEMEDIYSPDELIEAHEGLKKMIKLGNTLGSKP